MVKILSVATTNSLYREADEVVKSLAHSSSEMIISHPISTR